MDTTAAYLGQCWGITQEIAPWLMLGMLLAGVLHVWLPVGFIKRHLGGRGWGQVMKAVAVGVPMPLCSCGVIPAAIGLKKDGASDGAAVGFLISTPQTGVDSILVSATFLGWPFAIFKVISALASGLAGGGLVNAFATPATQSQGQGGAGACCSQKATTDTAKRGWRDVFRFGFSQLLADIYRWLIAGILGAALVSTFIPQGGLSGHWWSEGSTGLAVMLIISLPMYICATASVPLAASLVVAGMSPGAALVLLMAGPTTNIATIGTIYRTFGKKIVAIYLATVAVMSMGLGYLFDHLLTGVSPATGHMHTLPQWLSVASGIGLLILLVYFTALDFLKRTGRPKAPQAVSQTSR